MTSRLTERQGQAVLALLTSPTIEAAATSCGISSRTLRRWRESPDFLAMVDEVREAAFRGLADKFLGMTGEALEVIQHEMHAGETSADRLRAASLVVNNLIRLTEISDIAARLSRLEQGVSHDNSYEITS